MAYVKTNWVSGSTVVRAAYMNKIENQLEFLDTNKVDKVAGKILSSNDYIDEDKQKLTSIPENVSEELISISAQLAETVQESVGFNLLDDTLATLVGTESYNSPFVEVPAETRICISTAGGYHGYITDIKWYDAEQVEILPAPTTPYDFLNWPSRSGKFITTPVNCVYITFTWRFLHASTGNTLAHDIMVNINEDVTDTLFNYQPFEIIKTLNPNLIKDLNNDVENLKANQLQLEKIVYVSPAGDDMNDGKTAETPYKTFEKATGEKPSIIYAFRGVYKYDRCLIDNQNNFTILPYDNDAIYPIDHSKTVRQKIVIDNGEVLDNLTSVSGLLEKTYSGGAFFTDVFVSKAMTPMINAKSPRAVVWQEFDDATLNARLTPLLTKAEVIAQVGSFTWDGTKIYINPFAGNTSRFVVAKTSTSVLDVKNVKNLMVEDVECLYQFYNNITLHNIGSSEIGNSHVKYANAGQGFSLNNTNSNLYNCTAFKVGNDGFNMHEYGDTNFFNCKATHCYDDGMSHHYGCTGTVHGGEYSFNGKGGILPAYGANVDIYNTICKGNVEMGIGYLYTSNGHAPMKGYINGNVLVNNATGLLVGANSEVIAVNTKYVGNTMDKNITGTLVEY